MAARHDAAHSALTEKADTEGQSLAAPPTQGSSRSLAGGDTVGRGAQDSQPPAEPESFRTASGSSLPAAYPPPLSPAAPHAAASPTAIHSAFDRMDAAPPPQVLTSSPQRLSVGVRDAGLGWVEVHTHAAAGQVSAVVGTSSAEAHAALSAQLPAMREYLAAQHVHVDTLGTQQFSPSAGQREHARDPRGEPARGEPAEPLRSGIERESADGEEETLSYISVRV